MERIDQPLKQKNIRYSSLQFVNKDFPYLLRKNCTLIDLAYFDTFYRNCHCMFPRACCTLHLLIRLFSCYIFFCVTCIEENVEFKIQEVLLRGKYAKKTSCGKAIVCPIFLLDNERTVRSVYSVCLFEIGLLLRSPGQSLGVLGVRESGLYIPDIARTTRQERQAATYSCILYLWKMQLR